MTGKREKEDEERRSRMLALVGAGAEHFREIQSTDAQALNIPDPAPQEKPEPRAQQKPRDDTNKKTQAPPLEEPVLGPEPQDHAQFLVKRRRSLRDDPAWIGTTLYLRRETHTALQDFCRQAGLDMSRVVQFCVASQMDERQRSPVLSQLLGGAD